MPLANQGYIEQGRTRLNEALTEARQLQHALTLAFALNFAAMFETGFGSPDQAHRCAEEAAAFSNEHGFPLYAARRQKFRKDAP